MLNYTSSLPKITLGTRRNAESKSAASIEYTRTDRTDPTSSWKGLQHQKGWKNNTNWYQLDVRLMKSHQASVYSDGYRGEMKIVEEHRQMIVKPLRGREVQLQRPTKYKVNEARETFHVKREDARGQGYRFSPFIKPVRKFLRLPRIFARERWSTRSTKNTWLYSSRLLSNIEHLDLEKRFSVSSCNFTRSNCVEKKNGLRK